MPDFGIFRGFNSKLFSDKLFAGQLPTQLGLIGSINILPLLLDLYPNAAAAYSLRKLRDAYTGSAIRVRRSSDNTEQDIGFVNNVLDTTSLTSFCGSGNGFVTTWYDQSGNARNATQTTAGNQPQIVSNGSIITINSKPAILSNNKSISNSLISVSRPMTDFFTYKVNSILGNGAECYYDGALAESNRGFFGRIQSSGTDTVYDGALLDGYTTTLNHTIASIIRNGANSEVFKNNSSVKTGTSGTYTPMNGIRFGKDHSDSNGSNLYYQEFIRYSSVSSNISPINSNINTYYGIY